MPQAIFAVAVWIGATIATALVPASAGFLVATVITDIIIAATFAGITAGLAFAADALAPSTPKPEGLRETQRQTIPPRRRGCGTVRLGGPFLHDEAYKSVLYRVVAFLDRPPEQILAYLLNQDQVVVTSDGTVMPMKNNAYRLQHVHVFTAYGQAGVNAFPNLTAEMPSTWPATCSGTGIFMGYIRCGSPDLQSYQIVFPRGKPQLNVIARVGPVYDWRAPGQDRADPSTWRVSVNPIVNLVHELWAYRDYDWDRDFAPTLAILTDEANRCDAPIGVLNMLAKVVRDAAVGDQSIVIQPGPTPPIGATFYVGGQSFVVTSVAPFAGVDLETGIVGSQIGWSVGAIAVSVALGSVTRWQADPAHPVTEPTYWCGGAWNADETEADTVKRFLECMDGFLARRGTDGAVLIRCGHYYEPTVVIGADEVIGYTWQPFVERAKAINQIIPSFVSPAYDYSQIDTTPMQDDADVAANGVSTQPLQPALCQSNGQVRRLAKRRLQKVMAHVETLTLKASGIRALGERYIRLQLPGEVEDLADIVLEIVGDYEVASNGLTVVLQVCQADPDIDAWNPYTDEGAGPADASGPSQSALSAPTVTSANLFMDGSGSASGGNVTVGTTGARLAIHASPPADMATRTDLTWFSQWRVAGDTAWVQNRFTDLPPGDVELDTGFVVAGVSLEVEAAYQTGAGSLSPWSPVVTVAGSGDALVRVRTL